jgi:probable H4MPT-linked C1 transfer pathway protein
MSQEASALRDAVVGWDIGGVNTKAVLVSGGRILAVQGLPYELQRAPGELASRLRDLADGVSAGVVGAHAVTMTAELSQMFRTKREGVSFVLDACETALSSTSVSVYSVDGRFLTTAAAREAPLAVAAANWSATARLVAGLHPNALLVDIGTTTTDLIPIVGGAVVACGRTDPERLASSELVYSGALRTPTEAIASHVDMGGRTMSVSAEGFALAGDVHLWRGDLAPADYTVPTPDGRPPTREFAGERLARVVCADRDLLDDAQVTAIASSLAESQVARIADAMSRVIDSHPSIVVACVTGLGTFLGTAAAGRLGLPVALLETALGASAARVAAAAAVALLFERWRGRD